VHFILSKKLK